MEAVKEATFPEIQQGEAVELTDATRCLQNSMLSEWPGAVYAMITLVYIVSSLFSL
jgi:hypothetical protein